MLINSKAFAIDLISVFFCVLLSTLTYKFLWTFSFPRIFFFFLHWQLWYNATFDRYAQLILGFFLPGFSWKKKEFEIGHWLKYYVQINDILKCLAFDENKKIILSLTALICTWRNYTFKQFALVSSGLN